MYYDSALICELEDIQDGLRLDNLADPGKDHVTAAIDYLMSRLDSARDYLSEAASTYLVGIVDGYLAGYQQHTAQALAVT